MWTCQMAWIRFFKCDVIARSSTKSFILLNSSALPASNPQESWKIKSGLLLNINSFSILCCPRWEMSVSTMECDRFYPYFDWPFNNIHINLNLRYQQHTKTHAGQAVTHLFSIPIEDFRLLCGSTNPLKNSCLARVWPTHNENSEHLEIFPGPFGSVCVVVRIADSPDRILPLAPSSELASLGGTPGRAPPADRGLSKCIIPRV